MLITVLVINLLISLFCLYSAWQIWQLRRTLANVADALTLYERDTHAVLYGAPPAILQGQKGTHALRQQYQRLTMQLQKVQQVLALVSFGQGVWRSTRRSRRFRSTRRPR